ncbi:hypothetical protein [Coleofasciculus chthonoplastes]|uniref:hypothetical protein n=1 Tax=Coleofasciculus chthonoplastes TaxID=64178 RepID=UPI003302E74C
MLARIIEEFKKVKDFRNKRGKRHELWVVFQEDNSRIKDCAVAEKFSLLITLIMNLYRTCGFLSISQGQAWLGNHWQKMLLI